MPTLLPTSQPRTSQRDALIGLCRLAGSSSQAIWDEALDLVLAGSGARAAIAYEAAPDGVIAVAHRNVPRELRGSIERVTRASSWFPAVKALRPRAGTVVENDLLASVRGAIDGAALTNAGWTAAVALPLHAGRNVAGVLLVAGDTPSKDALEFLQAAADVLALALARKRSNDDRAPSRELRAAKLAAVGTLAVSFADDLREPFGALEVQIREATRLVGDLRMAMGVVRELEKLADLTSEADAAVRRAQQIRARLLGCVRETPPETVSLASILRDTVSMFSSQLRERGIQIDPRIDGDCAIIGQREELSQLALQLLANAADAAEGAGTAQRRVLVTLKQEGATIALAIEDSGLGVSEATRAELFEPFFTTKEGRLGLGLTLVKQIALAHRGKLDVGKSELGGAAIKLVLPAARPLRTKPPRIAPTSKPSSRSIRAPVPGVLWIDDDGLFLRGIRRALKDWDVRTAMSATEAEGLLFADGDQSGPPLRVFCDVGLPDRSGHDLHRAVAARAPEIASRFVFVTGGVISAEVADYLVASGCPTLLKPVQMEEVESLLGHSPTTRPPELTDLAPSAPSKRTLPPVTARTGALVVTTTKTPSLPPEAPNPRARRVSQAKSAAARSDAPTTRMKRVTPKPAVKTLPSVPAAKSRKGD
jgi:signal transduction histidine kinase/ActR/RegA family two-component response regulator